MRLGDLNGDGLSDVVTGWEEGVVVRVYLHPGQARVRKPWPAVTVGRVPNVEDAFFADVDQDGRLDVVSCAEGRTRSIFVHWGPRSEAALLDPNAWRTERLPASRGRMMWMFAAAMQVNDLGSVDLVAGGKGTGAALGWWQVPELPRQLSRWQWHPLRPLAWLMSVVVEDMNGDGRTDILFTDRKGARRGCFWLERPSADPERAEAWREHAVAGQGRQVMFLTVADLDRDGLKDVIIAVAPQTILLCRRLDASGERWDVTPVAMPASAGTAKAVAAGDVNGDGRPDLVFTTEHATQGTQGVMWMSYQHGPFEPAWEPHPISGADGVKHDLLELIDLDQDGDLDVLTCEEARNLGVFWYENPLR